MQCFNIRRFSKCDLHRSGDDVSDVEVEVKIEASRSVGGEWWGKKESYLRDSPATNTKSAYDSIDGSERAEMDERKEIVVITERIELG